MQESARESLGARERRRVETYASLTDHARTFTLARGLNGFTIEELCEAAGVSRRTFFNYFSTKEDAVLGVKPASPLEPFAQDFVDSGPGNAADGFGRRQALPLDEALAELFLKAYSTMDVPPADMHAFMRVMHSEPALMKRTIDSAMQRERALAQLIARRQGLPPGDRFATLASTLFSHLAMTSFQQFVGRASPCSADDHSGVPPSSEAPTADETTDEALERFTRILTENFSHARRLFGA
ncbi:MAG: TetR/AcrR family transcriptional regulator [Micrococcaceae bacterium]|uniref:TetR/AcrR family transcriptional regulator n=1 Tax=Arthrobacter sp. 179 TaxID=3457734 RepID=UPI0026538BB4|nr:TetR/AcrR family transcriptional regulator [Micrococcaceae bacterium]MDN5878896.1 TetR/AcrR family transcriptional regulator [Micrococcaceae bacterium]MDN5885645.1 TetR/AcrR family transcriptional regulator [Micrococcaceae bacterium]MDN5904859.1 TetR/AcrR family transcriptional regulator [Micrococcaceae bacterium]MDN6169927.1 TetR/AcrR family transcriptional regulator [Micrococcaceae bacterium]